MLYISHKFPTALTGKQSHSLVYWAFIQGENLFRVIYALPILVYPVYMIHRISQEMCMQFTRGCAVLWSGYVWSLQHPITHISLCGVGRYQQYKYILSDVVFLIYSIFPEICAHFVVVWYCLILPISFRVTSLALGQSYDCPSANEATLVGRGKIILYQIKTKHKKAWTMYIITVTSYGISNHWQHNCLFNRLAKNVSKLCITGLSWAFREFMGGFPVMQKAFSCHDIIMISWDIG